MRLISGIGGKEMINGLFFPWHYPYCAFDDIRLTQGTKVGGFADVRISDAARFESRPQQHPNLGHGG